VQRDQGWSQTRITGLRQRAEIYKIWLSTKAELARNPVAGALTSWEIAFDCLALGRSSR
jgi:hypothetical protein